jgi:hypothetical protein
LLASGLARAVKAVGHAARANFSGMGKPSSIIRNSNGNVSFPSATNVVAACEGG